MSNFRMRLKIIHCNGISDLEVLTTNKFSFATFCGQKIRMLHLMHPCFLIRTLSSKERKRSYWDMFCFSVGLATCTAWLTPLLWWPGVHMNILVFHTENCLSALTPECCGLLGRSDLWQLKAARNSWRLLGSVEVQWPLSAVNCWGVVATGSYLIASHAWPWVGWVHFAMITQR